MSMRVIDLLSDNDDDDDDTLFAGTAPIFASSSTTAPAVVVAPRLEPNATPHLIPLGTCQFSIVGLRYHAGTVTPGEPVQLLRETFNLHDKNAVCAKNAKGLTVGHLKKEHAAKLAPIFDRMTNVIVQAVIPAQQGNSHSYLSQVPVTITLLVQSDRQLSNFELEPVLASVKSYLGPAAFQRTKTPKDIKPPPPPISSNARVTPSPTDHHRGPLQVLSTGRANIAHTSHDLLPDQKSSMSMAAAYGTDDEAQDSSTEVADLKSAMRESLQSLTQGLLEATAGDHAQVEMTAVDWANQSQQLDELFDEQAKNRLALLPAYAMPPQFKNLQLYDYQQDGIRWLIHQERNQNAVAPWFKEVSTLAGKKYKCCITGALLPRPPKAVCGGILADDMGLGKTLQTIGLILSNPPAGQRYPYRRQGIAARPAPRCTLIICPVSVIGNWYFQVNKHVNNKVPDKALKIRSYHGPKRGPMLDAAKSNDVDILVTSYHTIVADLKKILEEEQSQLKSKKRKKSCTTSIFDIVFHRIVLDEAHIIRNSETGFFKAVACLHGERKLCLTGTPFVNKPDDLFSLLTFLDVRPLNSKKVWQKHVQEKIAERKDSGLATIRTTMAFVALRRKKSEVEHTIQLVSKEVQYRKITFPEGTHKIVHDILYASARSAFLGLLRLGDDTVALNFMALLELILRVRQSCCHADLVPEERRRNATEVYEEINRRGLDALTEEEGQQLLDRIRGTFEKEDELEECAICLCEMEEESTVILRNCKHIFCQACINKVQNYCCPLCRISYTEEDMIKKSAAQTAAAGENKKPAAVKLQGGGGTQTGRPPKIQAMLDAIEEMDPDEKGVIFSQWTSYLNLIEAELRAVGHTYTRIDGTMNAEERLNAMERFDADGCNSMREPRFILCSLHACGTGINLTRGNVVMMMDCWWNRAAEDQAMDRVHRIGQKRPVRVMRFLMKDSIEERMVALQDSKAALGKGSLEKLQPEEKRKARLTTLKDLFEVQDIEELWAGEDEWS